MTPHEAAIQDILRVTSDPRRSEECKKVALDIILKEHVWRFQELQKNIVETSVPRELADRLQDLYDKFGISWRLLVLFKL